MMKQQPDKSNWIHELFFGGVVLYIILLVNLFLPKKFSIFYGVQTYFYRVFNIKQNEIADNQPFLSPNEIGDAIGGITNSVLALISAYLIYRTFEEQRKLFRFEKKKANEEKANAEIERLTRLLDNAVENHHRLMATLEGHTEKINEFYNSSGIKLVRYRKIRFSVYLTEVNNVVHFNDSLNNKIDYFNANNIFII
jgi:hypothetical protein